MLQHTGYLSGRDQDIVRSDIDFLVTSCGHYKLAEHPYFETLRKEGRKDYQLLYVADGSIELELESGRIDVNAGQAILFRPHQPQRYFYRLEKHPDVFWMHFTGQKAENILNDFGLCETVFYVGVRREYSDILDHIIRELQLKKQGFSYICSGYGTELVALMGRTQNLRAESESDKIMELVLENFHRDFYMDFNISELAEKWGMSESWFIRAFRKRTGMSPHHYLTSLRLRQAQELMKSTSLNIGEIAGMCGYENALYFSRIFRKYNGISPSGFRKNAVSQAQKK